MLYDDIRLLLLLDRQAKSSQNHQNHTWLVFHQCNFISKFQVNKKYRLPENYQKLFNNFFFSNLSKTMELPQITETPYHIK
jgi:hypothetical protein